MIVGLVHGGINTNVVPDRFTLRLDRRMTPEEAPAEVEARLRALIEDAVRGHDGIRVEIRRLLLANALQPLPGHEKLVAAIRAHAARVFGEDIPAVGVPLYSDARLYAEHGVPTSCTAPVRGRSPNPTRSGRTRICCSRICAAPHKSSRRRCTICCAPELHGLAPPERHWGQRGKVGGARSGLRRIQ